MTEFCSDPSKCPTSQATMQQLEQVQGALEENNRKQEETNLSLVKAVGSIETLTRLMEANKKETDKDISQLEGHVETLYTRSNAANLHIQTVESNLEIKLTEKIGDVSAQIATKVGELNTAQAKKITIGDVIRLITFVGSVIALIAVSVQVF